jgi:hypothetical protein
MTPTRRIATVVGLLFLAQTIAFIAAEQVITAVLKRPDYLTTLSGEANTLTLGALLAFVSGAAVVGISVLMFPLLKPTSEPLALGYVGERVVELVVQVVFYVAAPLVMIAIAAGLRDGSVDPSLSHSAGSVLKAVHDVAIVVLYLVTSVGGTVFAALLYRSALVPRSLAVLGLIGYPALLVGCILDLFGATDVTQGVGLLAVVPGGFFELFLPIWLLAKGFRSVSTGARAANVALGLGAA